MAMASKSRFRFNKDLELHLLREVYGQNPYEDIKKWEIIQTHMMQISGKTISVRTLRERVQNLLKKHAEILEKELQGASGIEVEVTELDDLLNQIKELIKLHYKEKEKTNTSCFQRGFELREEASNSIEFMEVYNINEDELVNEQDTENIAPKIENPLVEEPAPTLPAPTPRGRRTLAQLDIEGPSRKRTKQGNIKQTNMNYLMKKQERQFDIRNRELLLEEYGFIRESETTFENCFRLFDEEGLLNSCFVLVAPNIFLHTKVVFYLLTNIS